MYILTLLFFAYKSITFVQEIIEVKDDTVKLVVHVIIFCIALGLLLYIWFGIIPAILGSYTITTSIEMMKDREIIHKVISL